MIEAFTFSGAEPGRRFLVLGSVHGDEKCGTYAIRRIMKELESGDLKIERGSVTFVPVCNQAAFDADTRWIDRNLNRYLVPHKNPVLNEEKIANDLCPLLEKCDVLLDLHSYHSGNGSYVYVGMPGSEEHVYANCLGADAGLTGWAAAYAASGSAKKAADPDESTGTTEYARRFGAIAATLECGQHRSPESPEVAYRAIRNALNYLGLNSQFVGGAAKAAISKLIAIQKVYYRGEGGHFTRDWKELDPVKQGETVAIDEKGQSLAAPGDGYIVLPNANAPADAEWFYWGHERN